MGRHERGDVVLVYNRAPHNPDIQTVEGTARVVRVLRHGASPYEPGRYEVEFVHEPGKTYRRWIH